MTTARSRMRPHRRHERDGVRRFLLAAVNPDRSDREVAHLLDAADLRAVVRLARRHRVAALLHDRLRDLDGTVASTLAAQLRYDHLEARARQLQAHATIAALRSALTVPFLIIKGAALAQRWYDDPSLRTYVDIDVLVRHTDFRGASEALVNAGFTHLLPSWNGLLARGMAEVPLKHRSSTVDLHWHLIARQDPRREIELDEAAIFDRADALTLGGVDVATLDCEDTLLHLCIHSGLDGGRRLHQLVDVDRVIRSGRINWDRFTARAKEAKAHPLCGAIVQRCHELIGTPVPEELLAHLQPFYGWTSANAIVNQYRRPDHRTFTGIASGILVAAGRATRAATIVNIARAVHEATHDRVVQMRMAREPCDVAGSTSRGHEDPRSRERYLAWVDEQAAVSASPPVG